tara:strand:- start:400 stop:738 length:339 start_codon:yes stop_codon:yes gene_type:complete
MTRVRVMYWKEIPVQVQAEGQTGRASRQLSERFQKAVDAIAMKDGSVGTDEYLDGWGFGPYTEVQGEPEYEARLLADRLEHMPHDFVRRIADMHDSGARITEPGSIDHWAVG